MRAAWFAAALLVIAGLAWSQEEPPPPPPPPPAQPIPYSHKHHAGTLKIACTNCHENADPGELMGIPATAKCMTCHQAIKTDSPHIQKLTSYHKANRDLPWARVYQIPSYVFFSHREHLKAGNTCAECHGKVAERDALFREMPVNMGNCMECHQKKKAPNNCTFCHEQRN